MKVLIVDDEDGMRNMLSFALNGRGFDVRTAEDGLKGLQAIKDQDCDILLTDIKMPGMDGIALLREVKKRKPAVEIIVMTGFGTAETETTVLREGAYAFIRKPFLLDSLWTLFDKCIAKIKKSQTADRSLPPKIVLVVDDEPGIQQLIKFELESGEYAVLTAGNGREAIETVTNSKIFAVLLDLGLPGMSGFDVLQEIKKIKPSLSVVIVTGLHDEAEARKAFELGAVDYVTKPIDFNYLNKILLSQGI